MTAFNPDLIDYIIQISVLFLRLKWLFAIAARRITSRQPLLNTVSVEYLLAIATLNRSYRNTETYRADKWVYKSTVHLLDIIFTEAIRFLEHIFHEISIDSIDLLLGLHSAVLLQLRQTKFFC